MKEIKKALVAPCVVLASSLVFLPACQKSANKKIPVRPAARQKLNVPDNANIKITEAGKVAEIPASDNSQIPRPSFNDKAPMQLSISKRSENITVAKWTDLQNSQAHTQESLKLENSTTETNNKKVQLDFTQYSKDSNQMDLALVYLTDERQEKAKKSALGVVKSWDIGEKQEILNLPIPRHSSLLAQVNNVFFHQTEAATQMNKSTPLVAFFFPSANNNCYSYEVESDNVDLSKCSDDKNSPDRVLFQLKRNNSQAIVHEIITKPDFTNEEMQKVLDELQKEISDEIQTPSAQMSFELPNTLNEMTEEGLKISVDGEDLAADQFSVSENLLIIASEKALKGGAKIQVSYSLK